MEAMTHYEALGLGDHDRAATIRGAYRDLVRRYHPARVGPGGERNFRPIAEAYRVLSDSSLRRSYDDSRFREEAEARAVASEPVAPPVEVLSLRRAWILSMPAGEAMLARFSRNFSGVGVPKSESADCLRVRFVIAPRGLDEGVVLRLGLPVLVRCEACAGHGGTALARCRACDGEGLVQSERAIAVTIAPRSADGASQELSLAPLGIHNFYLRAVAQVDPGLN